MISLDIFSFLSYALTDYLLLSLAILFGLVFSILGASWYYYERPYKRKLEAKIGENLNEFLNDQLVDFQNKTERNLNTAWASATQDYEAKTKAAELKFQSYFDMLSARIDERKNSLEKRIEALEKAESIKLPNIVLTDTTDPLVAFKDLQTLDKYAEIVIESIKQVKTLVLDPLDKARTQRIQVLKSQITERTEPKPIATKPISPLDYHENLGPFPGPFPFRPNPIDNPEPGAIESEQKKSRWAKIKSVLIP